MLLVDCLLLGVLRGKQGERKCSHHPVGGDDNLKRAGRQALVERLRGKQRGKVGAPSAILLSFQHALQHPEVQLHSLQSNDAALSESMSRHCIRHAPAIQPISMP